MIEISSLSFHVGARKINESEKNNTSLIPQKIYKGTALMVNSH